MKSFHFHFHVFFFMFISKKSLDPEFLKKLNSSAPPGKRRTEKWKAFLSRSQLSSFSWVIFDGSNVISVVLRDSYDLRNRDSDRTFSYDLINPSAPLLCCCSKWRFFITICKNIDKNIDWKDIKAAVMMTLSGLRTLRRCISHRSLRIGRTLPLLVFKNDITMRNTRAVEFASRSLSDQPSGLSQQELDSSSFLTPSYLDFLDRLAEAGDMEHMIQTLKDVSVDDSSKSSFYSSH